MLEKKLHSIPWPTLGDGADIAEKISKIIQENRGDAPPDVEDEENLEIDVQSVVEQIIQRPVEYSVSPAVAARLSTEPDYRRVVVVAGMVRASRLWPLSLLIYIPQGIEEITCFSHKEWTVRQRGNKALLKAEGNPFASDEQVTQLLRKIVSMPGVTGNKALTEAEPMAEIQFGTIMRLSCAIDPVVSSRDDVVAAIRLPQAGRWKDLGVYVKEGVITPGVATFLAACRRPDHPGPGHGQQQPGHRPAAGVRAGLPAHRRHRAGARQRRRHAERPRPPGARPRRPGRPDRSGHPGAEIGR